MDASTPQAFRQFKPGRMQWAIGAVLLLAVLVSGFTAINFGSARIILLIVILIGWAFWVWSRPSGGRELIVPILAIVTALLVGGIIILFGARKVGPLLALPMGYWALLDGAFLTSNGLSDTLVKSIPLILTGLAVVLAFRSGLFNIGAAGQFVIGAICAVYVGYAIELPPVLHAIVALLAGMLGGALWASIAGILKAWVGAHEVINTIMMNFIAIRLMDFLVRGPMREYPISASNIRTPVIHPSANISMFNELFPDIFSPTQRVNVGLMIAILAAMAVWWLLWKTTIGFELRTSGANPDAARYAGVRSGRTVVLAMALSGALAGMAGAIEIQGLDRYLPVFFYSGYGFNAIAIALLAGNNPFGVIPAAILFGALDTGSSVLQIRTGVSEHVIEIVQSLILLFVAAPVMIKWLFHRWLLSRYHIDVGDTEQVAMTRGWGG